MKVKTHIADRGARTTLEHIDILVAATKKCVEGGGFPIYLGDLVDRVQDLQCLAVAFNSLNSLDYDIKSARRRVKK